MIVLFTDFGLAGPYTGQMKARLYQEAPGVPVVDLFADAPVWSPRLSAYLLAAYAGKFPAGAVFVAVVDPGVGGDRAPLVIAIEDHWFVGPDNGLFELLIRRARDHAAWRITWRGESLSHTFHGRDLFAPVAARLARGEPPPGTPHRPWRPSQWPDDLAQVVYTDVYGNLITGLRAETVAPTQRLQAGGREIAHAPTFSAVPEGTVFWYGNSNGLVELAVNRGRADQVLGLLPGDVVVVL